MRACAVVTVVTVAAAGLLAMGAAPAAQATPGAVRALGCTGANPHDFDGDHCSDLAAASVEDLRVFYGDSPTSVGGRVQDLPITGTDALATGDVDGDGIADLVVGRTRDDGPVFAGEVQVVYGSPTGLGGGRATTVIRRETYPGNGTSTAYDGFGSDVAVSATGELAIGVPGADVSGKDDAGAVERVRLRGAPSTTWVTQAGPIPGTPEAQDGFGSAVAWAGGDLVVGVPYQDVDGQRDAGVVDVVPASGPPFGVSQNTAGMPGTAEASDFFGSALATTTLDDGVRVAIGVPFEAVGSTRLVGMVNFLQRRTGASTLSPDSLQLTQDTPGVVGANEAGDKFGDVLAAGVTGGRSTLFVGVPYENVGTSGGADAGAVVRVVIGRTLADHTLTSTSAHQGDGHVTGTPEGGDHFGWAITALPGNPGQDSTGWYGVPNENVRGVVDRGGVQGGVGGSGVLSPPNTSDQTAWGAALG